jgi:atypical dual specificity phosphatase
MTAAEAIDIVRAKRGIICPNDGFRSQLAIYSERFVGKRGKQSSKEDSLETSKISEGIADHIHRLKAGGVMASASPLQQVEVEECG